MIVTVAPPSTVVRRPRRTRAFTVDEFYRLAAAGFLGPNHQRLELIEGEILEPMPIGPAHAAAVTRIYSIFNKAVGNRFIVRSQNPVQLGQFSQPLPDISVVRQRDDSYRTAHPGAGDVLLLIEVADSTLEFDLGEKGRTYAEAAIVEYWVVDLAGERLRVFRRPVGGEFTETRLAGRDETIQPLAIPEFSIGVHELLSS